MEGASVSKAGMAAWVIDIVAIRHRGHRRPPTVHRFSAIHLGAAAVRKLSIQPCMGEVVPAQRSWTSGSLGVSAAQCSAGES